MCYANLTGQKIEIQKFNILECLLEKWKVLTCNLGTNTKSGCSSPADTAPEVQVLSVVQGRFGPILCRMTDQKVSLPFKFLL